MELYVHPLTPNSARVLALAHDLHLELDIIPVDITKGETRTPEFLGINPLGTVPVLVDDDLVLWESRPIMGYLAAMRPELVLYPVSPDHRANVDQWLFWEAQTLGPAMFALGDERVVKPRMGQPADMDREADAEARVLQHLPHLNAALKGKDGVIGTVTIADYALAMWFALREGMGLDLDRFPEITRWIEAMETRPGLANAAKRARGAFLA
ncbi:MAG: glutathione S-transferase family protein [Rhodobacteraceae bacterium]|nr:glutathione S-transferase family protein [Paracoccaceae bacterium]